ncbi:MAG: hypothetical protein ACK5U4_25410, partial [Rhodospirillales bacterium]
AMAAGLLCLGKVESVAVAVRVPNLAFGAPCAQMAGVGIPNSEKRGEAFDFRVEIIDHCEPPKLSIAAQSGETLPMRSDRPRHRERGARTYEKTGRRPRTRAFRAAVWLWENRVAAENGLRRDAGGIAWGACLIAPASIAMPETALELQNFADAQLVFFND